MTGARVGAGLRAGFMAGLWVGLVAGLWVGLVAGLRVGQAYGVFHLPGFGLGDYQAPGHPTSICDIGINCY